MLNNRNTQVVAMELWRFCAHCLAAIVMAGAVLIGFVVAWPLALKVGVLPLLGLLVADTLVRRHADDYF